MKEAIIDSFLSFFFCFQLSGLQVLLTVIEAAVTVDWVAKSKCRL